MKPVTIYTTAWCPYCSAAKSLLRDKGIAFTEIDVEKTAGCDDLYALNGAGKLDPLVAA
jgi:glutaredoxin 3